MRNAIGIAGAGAIAGSMGRLLREAGEPVGFVASRSLDRARACAAFIGDGVEAVALAELSRRADHLLIAVSDDALEEVASVLAAASPLPGYAVHTCGSRGPEALLSLVRAGWECGVLHPLQSVPSADRGVAVLPHSWFGICGSAPAVTWARKLVSAFNGRPLEVSAGHWTLYHLAAVIACNYQPALLDTASRLMEQAGITAAEARLALSPLVRVTIENTLELGVERALTGPIRRGDAGTIRSHLEALSSQPAPLGALYRACGLATIPIAVRAGLPAAKASEIEVLLRAAG